MASLTFNIAKKRRLSVPVLAFTEPEPEAETEQPESEKEKDQAAQLLQVGLYGTGNSAVAKAFMASCIASASVCTC